MNKYVIALACVLLLAACAPNPTPTPTPTPSPTPTPTITPTLAPEYETLELHVIPAESVADFTVSFAGASITGKLSTQSGTVTLVESDSGSHVIIDIIIDVAGLDSGVGALNGILRSILKTGDYPTARLYSEAIDILPGRYPRGDEVAIITYPSELMMMDRVVDIDVDTRATLRGRRMEITAIFTLTFDQLGLSTPLLVGNDIAFDMKLVTE